METDLTHDVPDMVYSAGHEVVAVALTSRMHELPESVAVYVVDATQE